MNTCKKIKELILTSYLDNELDVPQKVLLERHLKVCPGCTEFAKRAEEKTVVPFAKSSQKQVPEGIWLAIKERIETKPRLVFGYRPLTLSMVFSNGVNELKDLIDRLHKQLLFPRLAPIIASIVVIVLTGLILIRTHQVQLAKEKEQSQYLISLMNQNTAVNGEDNNFGTNIEEYFL